MQHPMPVLPQSTTLNPLKDAAKVEAIDYLQDLENLFVRFDSLIHFIIAGKQKMIW